MAKAGAERLEPEEPQITEGGLRKEWKKREVERRVWDAGRGRVVKWERKARVNFLCGFFF